MAMTEVFMGNSKQYTDEFRAEAVKQVIERGDPGRERVLDAIADGGALPTALMVQQHPQFGHLGF